MILSKKLTITCGIDLVHQGKLDKQMNKGHKRQ